MIIDKTTVDATEPPTVLADLSGKIIHLNNEAISAEIGVQCGDNISKFIDLDYISKMTLYNKRMDVIVPKECDYKKAVIKILGSGVAKSVELCFYNAKEKYSEEELLDDKRLLATYDDVIVRKIGGKTSLESFFAQTVEALAHDLRFAYRKVEIKCLPDCGELYANFAHLSIIAVATIVMLNEINCKNPIKIMLDRIGDKHIIDISVAENTFTNASGFFALEKKYPHIAMRLMYISSLCQADGIECEAFVKPNLINIRYIVGSTDIEAGSLCVPVLISNIQDASAYALEIFASRDLFNEETEEEQE